MMPLVLSVLITLPAGNDIGPSCKPSMVIELPCRGNVRKEIYEPRAGDILFFRTTNLVWKASCLVTMCGKATHVGIVVARPNGSLGLLQTPTVGGPVEITDIVSYMVQQGGQYWVRRRCVALTPQQSENLTTFACAQVGKPYDYAGWMAMPCCRPIQCLPKKTVDVYDVDRPSWFCSSLVVGACIAANLIDYTKVRPTCVCSSDLMKDCNIDLSCGWEHHLTLVLDQCNCTK